MRQINGDAGTVSGAFAQVGIHSFDEAIRYIKNLPYRRNKNKEDLLIVLTDQYGTCSTKHALLKQLAVENGWDDVHLYLGIFLMTAANTPKIAAVLDEYQLTGIPEAHNYLKVGGIIVDATNPCSTEKDFIDNLMGETKIQPNQISTYKVAFHKDFLAHWLHELHISYTLDEMWAIREECIAALSV